MAFSDFKVISEVQEKFRITYTIRDFIGAEETLNPSDQFLQEFEFCMEHINVFASETSRCEAVIFPVLKEIYKGYTDRYTLWSGKPITYDETLRGHTGLLYRDPLRIRAVRCRQTADNPGRSQEKRL